MKRLIIFILIFFNFAIFSNDKLFMLLITNQNNESSLGIFEFEKLKKCDFPIGPMRNNSLDIDDFTKITPQRAESVRQNINEKEYGELQLFCLDTNQDGKKYKTCTFVLNKHDNLGYAFNLDCDLKEVKGALITADQWDDLNIDIGTDTPPPPPPAKPDPSYIETVLAKIGVFLFVKYVNLINYLESFKKA